MMRRVFPLGRGLAVGCVVGLFLAWSGPAESPGLQAGDVILEVDRSPVAGGLDAEQKLRDAGEKTLLLVRRDEASFFTAVQRSEG